MNHPADCRCVNCVYWKFKPTAPNVEALKVWEVRLTGNYASGLAIVVAATAERAVELTNEHANRTTPGFGLYANEGAKELPFAATGEARVACHEHFLI